MSGKLQCFERTHGGEWSQSIGTTGFVPEKKKTVGVGLWSERQNEPGLRKKERDGRAQPEFRNRPSFG